MKALWHISETESKILPATDLLNADTIIAAQYSLISMGTERLVANGNVPVSLYKTMAVPYMQGDFNFPIKYGYSLVGKVIESTVLPIGQLIHVMHPHQDICSIHSNSTCNIPTTIPAKRAVLVANMETVINAVWDAALLQKSIVLIAGYGTIGAMLARVCKQHYDCIVHVLEQDEDKKNVIIAHGYLLAKADEMFDVAFNCSADEIALQYCIDNVKAEATVIELSWYGTKKISISLGGSFHSMRKKIVASQVAAIPLLQQKDWDFLKRKTFAFELLQDDFFDLLLTNEIIFGQSMDFFNNNRQSNLTGIGYYIRY